MRWHDDLEPRLEALSNLFSACDTFNWAACRDRIGDWEAGVLRFLPAHGSPGGKIDTVAIACIVHVLAYWEEYLLSRARWRTTEQVVDLDKWRKVRAKQDATENCKCMAASEKLLRQDVVYFTSNERLVSEACL